MATTLMIQYFIFISAFCLHLRFSYGHHNDCSHVTNPELDPLLLHKGVKIVTYGEPCHPPRYLPVTIEKPIPPVEECVPEKIYQPLQLNYRAAALMPEPIYSQFEYPISVEVPKTTPLKICTPDPYRGKSYGYNIRVPPPESRIPIPNYNFDVHVLPPVPMVRTPEKPVQFLTGLTSRIDKILVPACENPSCRCKA